MLREFKIYNLWLSYYHAEFFEPNIVPRLIRGRPLRTLNEKFRQYAPRWP